MRAFCSKEHRTRRGQVINTGPGSESTREETEEGGGAYALEEAEDEVDGLGHNPLHLGRRHGGRAPPPCAARCLVDTRWRVENPSGGRLSQGGVYGSEAKLVASRDGRREECFVEFAV